MFFMLFLLIGCSPKVESTSPVEQAISASGYVKSKNQYAVYPKVNGIVEHVYVSSGDEIIKGSHLISVYNETQKINNETARLTADFYNYNSNVEQLNELKNKINSVVLKVKSDSIQYNRQLALKESGVGLAIELENAELMYKNSKSSYATAQNQYNEFKR
jgi:HlyD family secretion protein